MFSATLVKTINDKKFNELEAVRASRMLNKVIAGSIACAKRKKPQIRIKKPSFFYQRALIILIFFAFNIRQAATEFLVEIF
ncbi:MAG TPA: hypothetical protein VER14_04755 [Phototrophicaceae bacterium]|nr:hypothetical protein [Phototrophicaceae bacterium]